MNRDGVVVKRFGLTNPFPGPFPMHWLRTGQFFSEQDVVEYLRFLGLFRAT